MYALLLLNLIVPFVMILVGKLLQQHPIKDMNTHNGYNTPASSKSQAHWDYAQKIAPGIFISLGIISCVVEAALSIALFLFQVTVGTSVVTGMGIGFLFLLGAFCKTETMIKNKF